MKTLAYLIAILICSGCLKKPVRKSPVRLSPCAEFDQQTGKCLRRGDDSTPDDDDNDNPVLPTTLPITTTVTEPVILVEEPDASTDVELAVGSTCIGKCLYEKEGVNYELKCEIEECVIVLKTGGAPDLSQCSDKIKESEFVQSEVVCKILRKKPTGIDNFVKEGEHSLPLSKEIIEGKYACVATYSDDGSKAAVEVTAGSCDTQKARQFKLQLNFTR